MKRGTVHYRAEEGVARANEGAAPPQKRYFRQRAHINPLNVADAFEYPICPDRAQWRPHFPAFFDDADAARAADGGELARVDVADIGCGFGGLLFGLSPALPASLLVGMVRAAAAPPASSRCGRPSAAALRPPQNAPARAPAGDPRQGRRVRAPAHPRSAARRRRRAERRRRRRRRL
jgi:hypothetical protein